MATLTIGDKKVTVDDSFLKLSPQDQQRTVDEISESMGGGDKVAPYGLSGLITGQRQPESTGMDVVKGLGTGVVQGAIGLASMPAQLGQYLGKKATSGIDYMMGVPPEQTAQRQAQTQATLDKGGMLPNPANLGEYGPQYEPQTTPGKYAHTIGQFLPGSIPGGMRNMGAKLLAATAGGAASEGAGQLAQKHMPAAEPYARIAGGLLGGFAPAIARRAVTPLPVSQERQGLLNTMQQEGVELTAGQSSGRQGLRYAESELGGGRIHNINEQQGEQFTRAALRRVGENADRATPEIMDRAFTRIGNQFETLANRHALPADAQLATDVAGAVTDYAALVGPANRAPIVQNMANDLVNAAQNGMTGAAYNSITSRLARMARNNKDPQLADALREMRHAIDEAMERHLTNIGSPDLPAWREARNQYRNIIVLEQAATGAGEKAAEGIISASSLRNATVQKQGRRNYARGEGDYADLARAGEATMKPLPQSGTAPRNAARAVGTSIPALLGAAGGSAAGGPLGLLAGGLAGAALPYGLGRALLSGPARTYLSNQLVGQSPLALRRRAALSLLGSAPQINYSGGH